MLSRNFHVVNLATIVLLFQVGCSSDDREDSYQKRVSEGVAQRNRIAEEGITGKEPGRKAPSPIAPTDTSESDDDTTNRTGDEPNGADNANVETQPRPEPKPKPKKSSVANQEKKDANDGEESGVGENAVEPRHKALLAGLTIFVLAIFVGFEVITKVPPTLHTPLMSGSNAISGITLVGAVTVTGMGTAISLAAFTGFIAIVLATINVVGGFFVTHRMLSMFKKR